VCLLNRLRAGRLWHQTQLREQRDLVVVEVPTDDAPAGVEMPQADGVASVEAVDAVSGALMLLPRTVFERIGGFDEGYFLHCEDLDLCRRARDAGWRAVCARELRVVHAKGGSSRHRPVFVAWHKHRSMWRWFTKFDPVARNSALRALVWCGIWAAFAARVPLLLLRRARML